MKLVLATHNPGKVKEFRNAFSSFGVEILTGADVGAPEPEETGNSFHDNALIKALATYRHSGIPSLADDSGLCVNALGGDPGVHSADWAGPDKDFVKAMREIKDRLEGHEDWSASFKCVLAFVCRPDDPEYFEGQMDGKIVWPPRGNHGFGYDPFFVPDERPDKTLAELDVEDKQALSHRGRAIQSFVTNKLT